MKDVEHVLPYLTKRDIEVLKMIQANPGKTGFELRVTGGTLKWLKSWSLIISSYWWTHEIGPLFHQHWMLNRRGIRMLKYLDR